jgi:hypothetical protein
MMGKPTSTTQYKGICLPIVLAIREYNTHGVKNRPRARAVSEQEPEQI